MDGCLVFLHIPKTGGATLHPVIARQYRGQPTLTLSTLDRPLEVLADLPAEERAALRVVKGHLHHGVHRYLIGRVRYITMLRHPVRRVVSLYRYIRSEPRHPLHRTVVGADLDLEAFVAADLDRAQVRDGQTRQIAGVQDRDPTVDDLARALEHLEACAAVGLQERFDESLVLFRRRLGWRLPLYVRRNVTAAPPVDPAPAVVELIAARNRLDLALYDAAVRRFERDWTTVRAAGFEAALLRRASRWVTTARQRGG